ncbi:MAG TPA: DciA family protein, partial [Casimicrobiaceae bacterium]
MGRPPTHRPLASVIDSDAQLGAWSTRHRAEAELTRVLRRHLPRPIADRVRVSAARDGVLELAATAGAIAASLRQRAPQLRRDL